MPERKTIEVGEAVLGCMVRECVGVGCSESWLEEVPCG